MYDISPLALQLYVKDLELRAAVAPVRLLPAPAPEPARPASSRPLARALRRILAWARVTSPTPRVAE